MGSHPAELHVEWIECDGPPVAAAEPGLGVQLVRGLIEQQLGGTVSLDFAPGGLHGTVRIPLDTSDGEHLTIDEATLGSEPGASIPC